MMFLNDEDMVECPYNNSHRMLRKRLQSHLLKCRIHYPNVELRKCPFNLSHLIPEPEFTHHATNCPDRKLITQYKYDAPESVEEEVPKHTPIESEENWDETDVPDYDPKKYVENATVIRCPQGPTPSERKEFIKKERKRLGDVDSDEDNDDESRNSQNDERSERSRSPDLLFRNNSPQTRTNRDSRMYNCDDDPYYKRNDERNPRPQKSSRDTQRSDYYHNQRQTDRSPPYTSSRNNRSNNYDTDRYFSKNGNSASSRSNRDREDRHRRSRSRSPTHSARERSPARPYRSGSHFQFSRDRSPSRNSKYNGYSNESDRYKSRSPSYNRRRHDNF
ncbi:protein snwA [Musca domestica]|uniref:Protein snwA n=1 Tax=Musca domestica TaxID=7370 RepID=A0A9J7CKS1_MUSDO|nr:protein snwA [Musca domestica]